MYELWDEVYRIIKDEFKFKVPGHPKTKITHGIVWTSIEDPAHIQLDKADGMPSSKTKKKRAVEKSIGYPEGFIDDVIKDFKGDPRYNTKAKRKAAWGNTITKQTIKDAARRQGVKW